MAKKKVNAKIKSEPKEDAEATPENVTPEKQKGISIGGEPKEDAPTTMLTSPNRVLRSRSGTKADDKVKGKKSVGFDEKSKGKKPMEVEEKGKEKRCIAKRDNLRIEDEAGKRKVTSEEAGGPPKRINTGKPQKENIILAKGKKSDAGSPTGVKITKTSVNRKNVGKEAAESSATSSSRVLRSRKRGTNLDESSVVAKKVQKKSDPSRKAPARAVKKEQPKKLQKNITDKGKTKEGTEKLSAKRKTMSKCSEAKGRNDSDEVKAAPSTSLKIEEGKPVASNQGKQTGVQSEQKGNDENEKRRGKSKTGGSQANVEVRRNPVREARRNPIRETRTNLKIKN